MKLLRGREVDEVAGGDSGARAYGNMDRADPVENGGSGSGLEDPTRSRKGSRFGRTGRTKLNRLTSIRFVLTMEICRGK